MFQSETTKLWNFAERNDLFTFRTVGDVLEENQELKSEIKWLNDIIMNNITKLGMKKDKQILKFFILGFFLIFMKNRSPVAILM